MRASLRTLTVTISAILALGLTSPGAGAAPADAPVAEGELASKTVIHWSGLRAIVLRTTVDEVRLRHDDPQAPRMRIQHTGSFAMALVQSRWQPPESECDFAMCYSSYLTRITEAEKGFVIAGGVHEGWLPTKGMPIELYLVSDGEATLTIEPEGVAPSPTREYRAGGTFHGALRKLPVFCPTFSCDPDSGYLDGYAFGGSSYDVGQLGLAGSFAFSDSVPNPHVSSSRACMYPNTDSPDASAEPSAHPNGCDLPGEDSDVEDQASELVTEGLLTAQPHPGDAHWYVHPGVSGARYLGYRAKSIGPFAKIYGGYGVWIRYGIDGDDPGKQPDPGTTGVAPEKPSAGAADGGVVADDGSTHRGTDPSACDDRTAPRSVIGSARGARGRLTITGLATDDGCRAGVKQVQVAIARVSGKRCRFLSASGRLTAPRPCSRAVFLRARGTGRWRFEHRRVSRGRYRILSRATDAAGNVERSSRPISARVSAS